MKLLRTGGLVLFIVVALLLRTHLAAAAGKLVVGYAAMNARLTPLWLAEEQGYFSKYGGSRRRSFCEARRYW